MTKQAKAPKAQVVLDDKQSAIVRKFSALSTKASDAYNGLSVYSQAFMSSAVLFDGSWAQEAIDDLNKSLKAMQSKIERKSAGYSTFSSAKSVILKAYRLGVQDITGKSKSELEAECKALKPEAQASESEQGEAEQGEAEQGTVENMGKILAELTPKDLIEKAMELLIASGDSSPCQSLIKIAHAYINKKK